MDTEIEPQLKALKDKFHGDLEALANKFNQAKRPEEADRVKAEIKRFDEHGLDSEPVKKVPPDVRALWSSYLHGVVAIHQSVTLKRGTARAKYAQALTSLELSFRAKNDVEGQSSVRRARTALALRNAVDNNRLGLTEIAGKGDEVWRDIAKEGGYVVGFNASGGGWFQFHVLGSLTPIFATAKGTRDGQHRGNNDSKTTVMAKDGYASAA